MRTESAGPVLAARLGRNVETVVVVPIVGTLRAVEGLLRSPRAVSIRERGEVHLPLDDFERVVGESRPGSIEIEENLLAVLNHRRESVRRHAQALEVLREIRAGGDREPAQVPGLRLPLDAHQRRAVELIAAPAVSGACLFDEQGLGKTITALAAFHVMRQRGLVTRGLVVAPKMMVPEWEQDALRLLPPNYVVQTVLGPIAEKRRALDLPADLYVTNFESTVRLERRLARIVRERGERSLLIVDESFFVKNHDAARTRSVVALRKLVDRCVVLCGTPAPNRPADVIAQFDIADGGYAFKDFAPPEEPAAQRAAIKRVIETRAVFLRRLKEEVLPDLPRRALTRVGVPLQPVQQALYRQTLLGLTADVRAIGDAEFDSKVAHFLARRMRLLQICSNPSGVSDQYTETPAKLLALDALLDELILRRREKVVLWSFFTASLASMFERYAKFNPVRVDGEVQDSVVRREAVRRFQHDDSTMLFIANPAAAGAGITLHRARYAVYESMSNQAAHYLQSLDRVHRRGQDRDVEYLVLLCDRTIEEVEYDRLLSKERAARDLLGDTDPHVPTRREFLQELADAAQVLGIETSA